MPTGVEEDCGELAGEKGVRLCARVVVFCVCKMTLVAILFWQEMCDENDVDEEEEDQSLSR